MFTILSCSSHPQPLRQHCPQCGRTPVPYPLSTGEGCGHPLYKVSCKAGKLWFNALNGSSYLITSINPLTQRLIIQNPGYANAHTCISADFSSGGILLDTNLPFNITTSNTVMIMNCSLSVLEVYASINCSSTSRCHDFIRENGMAKAACGSMPQLICCWLKTGGSATEFKIRARKDRCSAYQSFVNLDMELPVSKWLESGIELEWALPEEPQCKTPLDCQDLPNSLCLQNRVNVAQKRCYCRPGFRWDPMNGICLAAGEKCKKGKHCHHQVKKKTPLIGVLAAAALLIGVTITVFVYKKQSRKRSEMGQLSLSKVRERILSISTSGIMGKMFTGEEIKRATNNFSKDNLLGSGGFGEVFKGTTSDGIVTAIKRAKPGNTKGTDQILNEVRILCQVNHRSLVKLVGCCVDLEQPLLVYEYIPNGTLYDHLHTSSSKKPPLTLHHRLTIAHQTADGLAYLHSSAAPPIYHRDIKSSNILLDEELNAKVSDFGLSRLAVSDTSHVTTCAQGTLGYLDPEYYLNFQLTDKSDVYSFGVVLLELLTSKKVIDFSRVDEDVNLVVYVRRVLNEKRLLDVVDPLIKEGANKLELESIKTLGSLAVACLDEKRQNRPSMKEAADEIEYIINLAKARLS
ncbi:wall-associated receptor kinase-like 20 isoform X2 [Euphorbia lathyris]|uniref:wall-associated receptor kinase-like 20 isoform X2 n=1 Tax=Euphorbia lathyris TaxID=212925 RepID=UPI0033135409